MKHLLVWPALVAALAGGSSQQSATPQRLTDQTWQVQGVARTGLVAAPALPAPSDGAPLVLVFHGHGGTAANASRGFAIHTHWPEAVVIYLQGLPTAGVVIDPRGRFPGWQSRVGDQGGRDLALTDAVIAWAKSHYAIDARRIYAAGHSNGGSMVYVLWAARGDTFAAFAPAASVFGANLASAKPKPALIVAGRQDALVSMAGQQRSIDAVLRLNRAATEGTPWAGVAQIHASPIGADVVTYVHAGGHAMPPDAGELMVKFFKAMKSPLQN